MVRRNKLLFIVFGLLTLIALPGHTRAAAPGPAPKGFSISPFLQQVNLQPTEAAKTFTLTLTNNTESLQELDLKAQDFGSLNDTGGVLLEGSKDYSQKYGLASWLTLEKNLVVLAPGESANVLATIENRPNLQPGGHYGAIIATVNNLDPETGNKAKLSQQLTSLVLATKLGGEKYDLKLSAAEPNGNWFHLPNKVKLRFQNPGNVHVVPRGVVSLKSPDGTLISKGIINTESAFVLPETFRELYVPLTPVKSALPIPGLYSISVDYRYEGIQKIANKSYKIQFISLGMYVLIGALIAIALLVVKRQRAKAKTTSK